MNTPAHLFVNLFLTRNTATTSTLAGGVAIGAVLPDLPSTIFYIMARFINNVPENVIWQELYPGSWWAIATAIAHSFVILGVLCALFAVARMKFGLLLFFSMLVHAVFDFLTHNFDAHAHFYPLSTYRFFGPVSYWDANFYGLYFGVGELLVTTAIFLWYLRKKIYFPWIGFVYAVYLAAYVYSVVFWA